MSSPSHDSSHSTELCLQLSGKSDQPRKIYSMKTSAVEDMPFYKASESQNDKKKVRRLFACGVCSYSSDVADNLHKHVSEKHGGTCAPEERYVCGGCEQKFVYMSPLRTHVRCHTNERPYKCPQCDYAGKTQSALANHVRMHTGEKPWNCEHCGRGFTRRDSMRRHISAHHTGHRPFKCDMCSYASVTQNSLKLHILAKHKKEKPYKCPQCEFSTSYRTDLDVHIRSHTGAKPYMCPHCTYASSNGSDLVKHIRRHTNDRFFKCRYCDYTSTERQTVEIHERGKHTSHRPFKCPHCPYRSAYQSHIPRHVQRIHVEGRRAYTRQRRFSKSHTQETIRALQKLKRLSSTDVDSTSTASSTIDTDTEDQQAPVSPDNSTSPPPKEENVDQEPNSLVPDFSSPAETQPTEPQVKGEREHPFFNVTWMREHWSNGGGPDDAMGDGACGDDGEKMTLETDSGEKEVEIKDEGHVIEKNADSKYVCFYCDRTFEDVGMLSQHISRHMK